MIYIHEGQPFKFLRRLDLESAEGREQGKRGRGGGVLRVETGLSN